MAEETAGFADTAALARRLGLSRWAVSRALNDQPGVGADTRKRVRAAARAAGFEPNAHARALRGGGGPGVVVVRVPSLRDPAWVSLAAGLCEGLLVRGLQPEWALAGAAADGPGETAAWAGYASRRPSAVLALGAGDAPASPAGGDHEPLPTPFPGRLELLRRGVPVIFVEPRWEGEPDGWPIVRFDHRAAAALVAAHLRAAGHRWVGLRGFTPAEQTRAVALGLACAARGIRCEPAESPAGGGGESSAPRGRFRAGSGRAVPGGGTVAGAASPPPVARNRPAPGPTALVAPDDLTALRALCELRGAGRRVPEDCAVVGYGDDPAGALGMPALTTVDPQRSQMVARTLELLDELLRDPGNTRAGALWIAPLLRCRGSVAVMPGTGK